MKLGLHVIIGPEHNFDILRSLRLTSFYVIVAQTFDTVDLGNFVPLFNFSLCSLSSISPKR